MDCCYSSKDGSLTYEKEFPNVSSPEMFDSDVEEDKKNEDTEPMEPCLAISPQKPTEADLIAKSDNTLLIKINKLLSGVPPPPKLTINRTDCSELLLRIYENYDLFWTPGVLSAKKTQQQIVQSDSPEQQKENISTNACPRAKSTYRNLSNAFDECDPEYQSVSNNNVDTIDVRSTSSGDNFSIKNVVPKGEKGVAIIKANNTNKSYNQEQVQTIESRVKHVSFAPIHKETLLYYNANAKTAATLKWPEAYHCTFHGIHYNRNNAIEEFENLTLKLCERYIGAETQSTCTVWFSKPPPGSAKKRSLLAKRNSGQSPGKRLSHLTRRRTTFSSANLQGLALNNKKMLVLNIKKPCIKKGKSPRGKSPRGKSPRGTPRSSAKKRAARRLALDGPSPMKAKIETSKRALFQSPPPDKAGPSKLFTATANPQSIKRALFTQNSQDDDSQGAREIMATEESRKRKCEEELEGPRCKWAKSLSFDCSHELHNTKVSSWDRHSSSNIIEKHKSTLSEGRCELSDTHRKKLLWAVAEALRSKGIGMTHPQFKQHATSLARTIKKFMPDLENKNIPRKPGSTSDRMLKLAKHHVLFVIEPKPTD